MAALQPMPAVVIPRPDLQGWGALWLGTAGGGVGGAPTIKNVNCFDRKQGMDFGSVFDRGFGVAVATMLGNVQVVIRDSADLFLLILTVLKSDKRES